MAKKEFVYFFLRNKKVIFAICTLSILSILAIFGPNLTPYDPLEFVGAPYQPPNKNHWLGTNTFGQDLFAQIVYGLRNSLIVGLLGGGIATVIGLCIGFIAGYKGGWFDEFLMMLTNILMVIPTLALLIIIAAYLPYRGIFIQSVIIGLTAWPWTARAVRAQTLSLKTREFVDLARITGVGSVKIIFQEIMPNMMSYVFMVFILQFGGAILAATGLDFIGLGPTRGISLGIMMQQATLWNAIQLGMWWWAITPGALITLIVATLYIMNTGLDEIFNPKLREM
ncbi:MAG: peptide/nickel transport system permease protein [Pseudothermotoga sp.]|nr:peptide/nickel transport system permease protein [Pseudothermotoga sp.]